MLGQILRGFFVISGTLVGAVAGAMVISAHRSRTVARSKVASCCSEHACSGESGNVEEPVAASPAATSVQRRDFFSITRCRTKDVRPQWVLQGFGRYQCFLLFDTWREAMDQASFQIEGLGSVELVQLRHS